MTCSLIGVESTVASSSNSNGGKFAIGITYIGKNYCGWQRQSPRDQNGRASIQDKVESVIHEITQETPNVVASGRTDAGVNALEQVAHFRLKKFKLTLDTMLMAMNSNLPDDIRVLWVKRVAADFHAQTSAIKKQYSYYYLEAPAHLPEWRFRTTWIRGSARNPLNVVPMNEAIVALVGKHDFKVFQASGSKPMKDTVREIFEADVTRMPISNFPVLNEQREGCNLVRIRLVGSGFLKQMVRGIAGTLRMIGEGKSPSTHIVDLLRSQQRQAVGPTAAPEGLWLERVWYP